MQPQKPMDNVRVNQITVENVFGVQSLSFDPDGVSVVRGDNDTGKTSIIRAISLLLGGGHDPEALHDGAEKGEVRFELDNGVEVYARLTESNTYYRIEGAEEDVTARALMERLYDELAVNPVEILNARPQDRGQILLEALPMTVDADRVRDAVDPVWDIAGEQISEFDLSEHALEVLGDDSGGIIGVLYTQRQQMHGAKRDKEGVVNDLEESVKQHEDPEDLKSQRDGVQSSIDDLQEDKEDDLKEVNKWEKKKLEEIRRKAQEKREKVREQYDPGIQELREKRERLNEKIEQAVAAEETKQTLQKRKEELATLEDRYERYTEAIERLRDLRTDFEDDLPRDVSIADDGEILNPEGRRFEYWNEQKQVHFAMEMSEMRDSPLNLIVLDGIERIVGEQREALLEWCRESDAQFILTEAVAGSELTIDHE